MQPAASEASIDSASGAWAGQDFNQFPCHRPWRSCLSDRRFRMSFSCTLYPVKKKTGLPPSRLPPPAAGPQATGSAMDPPRGFTPVVSDCRREMSPPISALLAHLLCRANSSAIPWRATLSIASLSHQSGEHSGCEHFRISNAYCLRPVWGPSLACTSAARRTIQW